MCSEGLLLTYITIYENAQTSKGGIRTRALLIESRAFYR